jgi:hypothetical protein
MTQLVEFLADGKSAVTEEQIEARETKIVDFDQREYLVQHIILITTSTRLGSEPKVCEGDVGSSED